MFDYKNNIKKIRILKLIIICLLLVIFRLVYVNILKESNLHKVLNDHVEAEPRKRDAENYANKQFKENLILKKQLNSLKNKSNFDSINSTLPDYTGKMEEALKKDFTDFYKFQGNASVQRKVIDQQSTENQYFFDIELDRLKNYRSIVDSVNFSYQIVNGKLLTLMIISTTEVKKTDLSTNKNTAIITDHIWKFYFDFNSMKIDKILEAFSAERLPTDT